MSENTLKARLVHPCKTDAEWASSNPVAKKGEIMISSDKSGMFKVGNGTNKWSDLQYNHVTWVNVEGKPSTFSPSAHKHTKIDITDFPSSMVNPHSIIIKLNGGTTEGSNLFTYNGGSSKTINITAGSIGAAAASHTHTKSQISDFPTSMPASDVYSWAKASSKPSYSWGEITGKPSSFTPSSHTHNYLPLSGGTMTGALNFTINTNSIYCSGNDSVNGPGGALNNLVINSWYGVSFTSTCDSTYKGKTAVGIDCREGIVKANTFEGKLAATAVYVNGNITATGSLRADGNVTTSSIELYAAKPYIDFHFDGNNGDYTSRIIENASGILNINGATFTNGGSVWCTSFSTDGGGTFGGDLSARRGLYLKHAKTSLYLYNDNGGFVIMHTGSDGNSTWPVIWSFASSDLYFNGNLRVEASGTFTKGITSKAESVFHTGSYTDPYPNKTCTIKSWGTVASLRFAAKGVSNTWLGAAKPDGAAYDTICTDANALVPGWRVRTADGAWVGASYAQDPGFRIYYCNASRLSGSSNGYDAVFTFGQSGTMYASSFSQTSDERRKNVITNLSTLPQAHKDFFMKLNPFTFKWKKEEDKQSHYGVGAQSVYQAALDCGFTDDDLGFIHKGKELPGTSIPWSVSYTEFIPLNIAVTQDHETRIEKLEAHASKLERENEELKQQIKELKGLTA